MSSIAVLSLPESLLLLIHLHILQYPYANEPEYDEHIFNVRIRGLRERAKTMEDVAYFLVGRIEGRSVKTVSNAIRHRSNLHITCNRFFRHIPVYNQLHLSHSEPRSLSIWRVCDINPFFLHQRDPAIRNCPRAENLI